MRNRASKRGRGDGLLHRNESSRSIQSQVAYRVVTT